MICLQKLLSLSQNSRSRAIIRNFMKNMEGSSSYTACLLTESIQSILEQRGNNENDAEPQVYDSSQEIDAICVKTMTNACSTYQNGKIASFRSILCFSDSNFILDPDLSEGVLCSHPCLSMVCPSIHGQPLNISETIH